MLAVSRNASSSSSTASRWSRVAASNSPRRCAISRSRFRISKRSRSVAMPSRMLSSFVALSMMWTGVITLPQSCSHAAMCSSYHSSGVRLNPASGPSFTSHAACASILVITGTRLQCSPVYGLFASIADAISWMKLSSSFFWASISSWLSSAMPACEASASTMRWRSGVNGITVPRVSRALISCSTPITRCSLFTIGQVRNDCER